MAIELHHLQPSHDDELSRLKARIAELERIDTEHTVQIAKMNGYIHHLEEERRWRKFPDEKPTEDTWCIVFHDGEIDSDHYTRFVYNKKCDFALYGYEVTHWMPLPSAPKEEK